MLFRVLYTIVVAAAVPAFAWFAAQFVLDDILGGGSVRTLCPPWEDSARCQRAFWAVAVREVGLMTGLGFVTLLAVFAMMAAIAGSNRARNAAIFPRLAPATTFAVGLLTLTQGAVLSGAVYLLFAQFVRPLGAFHYGFIGIVALGALGGGLSVIWTLLKAGREHPAGVPARQVTREQAPALWAFVDGLAEQLQAERPKNLLVGLEPTFFATAAPIALPEVRRPLHGASLYLSLPMMRLFTEAELRAVVGHELGHFRGADTNYSKKFAPVYRNLGEAITSLTGPDGSWRSPAAWSAIHVLMLMHDLFARNERHIGRQRELEADQAGVSVSDSASLATSLAKVAVFAPLWGLVRGENASRLSEGKFSRNLSTVFAQKALFDVDQHRIGEHIEQVLKVEIEHPTDTHPRIAERYRAIQFQPRSLSVEVLRHQGGVAAALLPKLAEMEEDLTIIEHKLMVAAGHARPPKEPPPQNLLLQATYILAATMVTADHEVHENEMRLAEGIGSEMFRDFDRTSFREIFPVLAELPEFMKMVDLVNALLEREHTQVIYDYLAAIAAADESVTKKERELLEKARRVWRARRR